MQSKFSIDDLKKRLQGSQHKMTPQRRVVLEVFLKNEGEHLSADEVHGFLKKNDSDIGLATVYRTLELMVDIGILQRVELYGDGISRYELDLAEPNAHQHHHLICLKCKKIIEVSDDLLEGLEAVVSERCKFKIVDHQVKFFGYCKECQ